MDSVAVFEAEETWVHQQQLLSGNYAKSSMQIRATPGHTQRDYWGAAAAGVVNEAEATYRAWQAAAAAHLNPRVVEHQRGEYARHITRLNTDFGSIGHFYANRITGEHNFQLLPQDALPRVSPENGP